MKKLIVASIAFLSLSSALYAGDVEVEVSASGATCGEAGVNAYKACIAKSEEDIFRVLDIKADYLSQEADAESCTVTAKCSFYQIID
ncbi:MAG: hypothetical protein CME70_02480 [Halobacteriovorax sp.]|nr:hypothetical protein [Halobacteriovorax sp.]